MTAVPGNLNNKVRARRRTRMWLPNEAVCRAAGIRALVPRALWMVGTILTWVLIPLQSGAEPRSLTNAWSVLLHYPVDSSPAIADDGTIYFGVWNGDLRALSPDGSPKWTFHAGREIKSSPAIGADGSIYFGSRDRKLYAVAPDGKRKWDYKTGAWVDSSPAIGADGTIYFGSWDKSFYALDSGGSKKWQFQTGGEIDSSPAVGADGRIYFGSHDRNFYALSPDGQKLWAFATAGPIISSAAIGKDVAIYFTSVDGYLYALKADSSLKWRLKTGGVSASSPVIGEDETIYVGVNSRLWAVTCDGRKKWEQDALLPIDATPLALADGSVCFDSRAGILCNLTSPNQRNWIFDQNWYGTVSPAIGSKGDVYAVGQILGTGCLLYGLRADATLAHSFWPKFRGNMRNTGIVR
jgi:outer membrane protein assembly factor BamB